MSGSELQVMVVEDHVFQRRIALRIHIKPLAGAQQVGFPGARFPP